MASLSGICPTNINPLEMRTERELEIERIKARYGDRDLSRRDILKIRQAERDGVACEGCSGLPCAKFSLHGVKPVIEFTDGGVIIRGEICGYARANRAQMAFERNFKAAKIPAIYLGKGFSEYVVDGDNKLAVGWARKTLRDGGGLYIFGAPGTGKTFLASVIAQAFLKKGRTVIFGDVPGLLDDLKATFESEARLADLMADLSGADVLILDDFGAESPTEWAAERLYKIINERYKSVKTLIITSNFNLTELEARLNTKRGGLSGKRIVSRLIQICNIVELSGGDRRIKGRSRQGVSNGKDDNHGAEGLRY